VPGEFPRIEVKPVVRNLNLVAINNLLLEDTISVSQSISPSWVVERSQGIEEASSQSTEATISKCSIVFLVDDILDSETQIRKALYSIVSICIISAELGKSCLLQHPSSQH
jgi:hypothetical protein